MLDDDGVLAALAGLRESGVRIGLSTSGAAQDETVERAIEVGGFDTVQATWNLLEPSSGPALAGAHDAGLGVIVKEAVANGRLTARGAIPELDEVARRLGASPDAVALAAVLAQPWVHLVLSGAATREHLASNLAAWELPWDDEAAAVLSGLAEDPETYWQERSDMQWN